MRADTRRRQRIAQLCMVAAVLMLLVLMTSAAIRLAHADCAHLAAPAIVVTIARAIHRVAASTVGVLLMVIAWLALRCRPVPRSRIVLLLMLFALTFFLAILGRFTTGNLAPVVTIGNVVAGMALLALFWRLRLEFTQEERGDPPDARLGTLTALARSLTGLQIWLGSWVAGTVAGVGCTVLPAGGSVALWPDALAWRALDPLHMPGGSAQAIAEAIGWLGLVHRLSAFVVLGVAVWLGVRLLRSGGYLQRAAYPLLALLAMQAALGIAMLFAGSTIWFEVAHNVLAALLLGMLVGIHYQCRTLPP